MPGQAHLYSELGLAYLKHRQDELAKEAFGRALVIDPDEPTALEYHLMLPTGVEK